MSNSKALMTNDEEVRIVMVGKTGVGKSATGNTILGYEAFESDFAGESLTIHCKKVRGVVDGRNISVVDTPGLFDTRFGVDRIINEMKQCICFAAPGPHVFLIVIRLGKFTEEEQKSVQIIKTVFGEMSNQYTMILFTGGDLLKGKTIEDFLKKSPKLEKLVIECDVRYHVFNNEVKDPAQVTELLAKIESMVERNGRSHYTTEMFQEAERAIQEEQQRILKENEQKRRKEMEKLIKQHQGEALEQEQAKLYAEHQQQSRMQAERNNSFLSNIVEGLKKAGEFLVEKVLVKGAEMVVDKCNTLIKIRVMAQKQLDDHTGTAQFIAPPGEILMACGYRRWYPEDIKNTVNTLPHIRSEPDRWEIALKAKIEELRLNTIEYIDLITKCCPRITAFLISQGTVLNGRNGFPFRCLSVWRKEDPQAPQVLLRDERHQVAVDKMIDNANKFV